MIQFLFSQDLEFGADLKTIFKFLKFKIEVK